MAKKRRCSICKKQINIKLFPRDAGKKDGLKCGCKACINKRNRDKKHNLNVRFNGYKKHSKKLNFSFELTIEQFKKISSKACFYCGGFSGKSKDGYFCGIDRVNTKKGYCVKNSVPCCSICNFMKGTLSKSKFLAHCQKIIFYLNNV